MRSTYNKPQSTLRKLPKRPPEISRNKTSLIRRMTNCMRLSWVKETREDTETTLMMFEK